MPELPEVETVRKILDTQLKNKVIQSVEVNWNNIIQHPSVEDFQNQIKNQTIKQVDRIGKYLMIELDDYMLISHLRMEGKYYIQAQLEVDKHTHVIFHLDHGYLLYHDVRKFGTMHLYLKNEPYTCLKNCGIDALLIDYDTFYERAHQKKYTLKHLLLDQKIMAGVGNIYADEIIFKSRLHPEQPVNSLTKTQFNEILDNTKAILGKAILAGGTTIRSYTSSLNVDGRFQLQLAVHTKKVCPICNQKIEKIKVATRGTYICQNCQKIK